MDNGKKKDSSSPLREKFYAIINNMVKEVVKRDGRIVKFSSSRIENAVRKAFLATKRENEKDVKELAKKIISRLHKKEVKRIHVEEIQDIVEETLMESGFKDVARAYILYRERRKELRESKEILGVKDDLKLPFNALRVLQKRYLRKDEYGKIVETPRQMFERVARTIAEVERDYGKEVGKWEKIFFEVMCNLEFLPNSPTLMNAGTPLGQLSACFVIPVEDSIEGIFRALHYMALIHQSGGGTGFSFSSLRPQGDVVRSTGGIASGPVSFMKIFDTATQVIKQGGRRRGANMGILSVHHPDILEFITAKEAPGILENFNISVSTTDEFMKAVEKDEDYPLINPRTGKEVKKIKAREVINLISYHAWKNGDPGIVWIDEINRHNPTPEIGRIEATNPCVSGETLIPTNRGMIRIKELLGKKNLKILCDERSIGKNGSSLRNPFKVFPTGKKKVMKITTRSGFELRATPDHLILTTEGWVPVEKLVPGKHQILIQHQEGFFPKASLLPQNPFAKKWNRELGWILGWLVGDGWLRYGDRNVRVGFCFGKEDKEAFEILRKALEKLYGKRVKEIVRPNGTIYLSYHSPRFARFFMSLGIKPVKAEDKEVPISLFTASKEAVKGFLSAIFTADGTINFVKGKSSYIRLTSKSKKLLREVQLLLLNMGIMSRIFDRSRRPSTKFFYQNKKGKTKYYKPDGILFELEISRSDVEIFLEKIGFLGNKFKEKISLLKNKKYYSSRSEDEVYEVKEDGETDVYDIVEPFTHSFIGNGMILHNCGEQPLLPYESCNLGSINLSRMLKKGKIDWERMKYTVEVAVRFLDNVIDASKFPIPEVEKITYANRKIGLGVMGFADLLIKLNIPYDSEEAEKIAEEIMRFIHKVAVETSMKLAEERGSFPNFKGSLWDRKGFKAMRNATLTTIAPTGTLSIIAGTTSGIEPLFAIAYTREVMEGTRLLEINKDFLHMVKKKGVYSREIIEETSRTGSIKDIKSIPESIKRLFVTSFDISPEWHIRIQATFQKYTDNAVSKTINFPEEATPTQIQKAFYLAYRLKCRGLTVYRYGSKKEQVLYRGNITPSRLEKDFLRVDSEFTGECRVCGV